MGLLTLYSGLLLPWLGGTFWLVFIESQRNTSTRPNRLRQTGYGFFIGYFVLFSAMLINHKLGVGLSWPGLMLLLLIFSAGGGVAVWLRRPNSSAGPPNTRIPPTMALRSVATIAVLLMAIHLVFITVEVFTQPLYPWDAWLTWIYRAKAWYLADGMVDMVGSADWTTATSASTYTIDAWLYPLFPSVIPYWAALSLGRWSETLINLPVLFAGLAMGMAIYGQCREQGLSAATSLVCCYLLYSIPLFGTHLALAGYADIWMAGFTGLGFIAVMRGAIVRTDTGKPDFQMILGLLMIGFGIFVKNEGAVWFLATLAMLILVTCRPRVPVLMMAAAVAMSLLTFALGYSHIEFPLIGKLGFVDDLLVIPFIGNFSLETHNVWPVYWDNFIAMGNWNLLWVLVAASLLLGFRSPNLSSGYRARRAALSFILIFLATQVFIFGFTDQGIWADTYTAINRLPLHFLPALIFAIILILQASLTQKPSADTTTEPEAVPVKIVLKLLLTTILSALLVIVGTLIFLAHDLPDQTGESLAYPVADFNFAFGSGHVSGDRMLVDEFANGYALLTSGPVSIQASSLRVLNYTWLPPGLPQEAAFFWRRSNDSQNVLRTGITAAGTNLIDLSMEPDWQGEITEFGFLVAGDNGVPVEIGNASLHADSLKIRLRLMWRAWAFFEEWSQQSINFLRGGEYRQVVPLPLLVAVWLLSALLFLWSFSNFGKNISSRKLLMTGSMLFVVAWMLLDIRWTANNLKQTQLSIDKRWQASEQQRSSNNLDGEIFKYTQRLKSEVLGEKNSRILIIGDENAIDYFMLRARYHLLPHSAAVEGSFANKLVPASLDFVIFFGQPGSIVKVPGWDLSWQNSLVEIDRGELGFVYKVE